MPRAPMYSRPVLLLPCLNDVGSMRVLAQITRPPAPPSLPVQQPAGRPAPGGRLAQNIGWLGLGQAFTWTMTLAWTLFVPRLIGPRGMGLIVMAASISGMVVGLAGLGSRPMLVKEIAADASRAPQLLTTALIVRGVLALPCTGLTALYVHLAGFHGAEAVAIYLGAAMAVLTLLSEVMQAGLQALERMGYLAASDVAGRGLQAGTAIPAALAGVGAIWLVGAQVGVTALVTGLNLAWGRRFGADWRLDGARFRSFLAGSLAYWAYALFFTFYLWIDATMLALMTPQQVVGWYGVPTRIFQTLMFLPVIFSTAWLPRLAAAHQRGPDQLKIAARMPIELVTVLSLPVAAGLALVARPLTLRLYGPAYEASIPVLEILALTLAPMYLNIIVNQVLVAGNRQGVWTKAMVLASIVNPAMNLLLIRYFQEHDGNGAIGAALSMLGTEVLIAALGVWVIRAHVDLRMLWRIGRGAAATAAMAVVAWFATPLGLTAEVTAGGVTFATCAVLLRVLSREELAELARLAGSMPVLSRLRRRWLAA